MMVYPPCMTCRHFYRDDRTKNACAAFPEGIPQPIWTAENHHREPYPGDHGILWELDSELPLNEEARRALQEG